MNGYNVFEQAALFISAGTAETAGVLNGMLARQLRNHGQAQGPEIGIESERWNIIEQRSDNDKGNRVAKGEFMVATVPAKDFFRFLIQGAGSDQLKVLIRQ